MRIQVVIHQPGVTRIIRASDPALVEALTTAIDAVRANHADAPADAGAPATAGELEAPVPRPAPQPTSVGD